MNTTLLATAMALGLVVITPATAGRGSLLDTRIQSNVSLETSRGADTASRREYWRDHDRRDNDRHDGRRGDRHRDGERDWRRDEHRWGSHGDSTYLRHERWRDHRDDRRHERYDNRRYWSYHRYRAPYRYMPPGGYRVYSWSIGHRLPPPFIDYSYGIDYRLYGLPRPPYGHRWIRVDNDVYLVVIRSGLVVDLRFGLFY